MITYLETSYPSDQISKCYKKESRNYEARSSEVFKKIRKCSNNESKVREVISDLVEEDFYRIKTNKVKYPKTLLCYAIGIASPNMIDALYESYDTLINEENYYASLEKQFIYAIINSNKYAILKLKSLLGSRLNMCYVDKDTGYNLLELAIFYNITPSLFKDLLNYQRASPLPVDKLLTIALNADLSVDIDRYATIILQILEKDGCSKDFMVKYFTKKIGEDMMSGHLFEDIEEYMMVKGISEYFEYCEEPIRMAKLWSNKLEPLEPFLKLIDKFVVNLVLNPSLAVTDFMNFVNKLHSENEDAPAICNEDTTIESEPDTSEDTTSEDTTSDSEFEYEIKIKIDNPPQIHSNGWEEECPRYPYIPLLDDPANGWIYNPDEWSWDTQDTLDIEYGWGLDLEKN